MRNLKTKDIAMVGVYTALTAVMAQIAVVLPVSPVQVSLCMIAVYISGIMQKPKYAALSQVCYLLLGAVGVPVFGNFKGGIGALLGPTGGYLVVYPLMAAMVAWALNGGGVLKRGKKAFAWAAVSICAAHVLLYAGGTVWLAVSMSTTFTEALVIGVYPYIILDIIKIVFCVVVIVPIRPRLFVLIQS